MRLSKHGAKVDKPSKTHFPTLRSGRLLPDKPLVPVVLPVKPEPLCVEPATPDLTAVVLKLSLGWPRELVSEEPRVDDPRPDVAPLAVLVGLFDEDNGLWLAVPVVLLLPSPVVPVVELGMVEELIGLDVSVPVVLELPKWLPSPWVVLVLPESTGSDDCPEP